MNTLQHVCFLLVCAAFVRVSLPIVAWYFFAELWYFGI